MTGATDVTVVTELPEVMRYVLLSMLEVVEGVLRLLEVSEVMRSVLLCTLEVVEGELCLLRCLSRCDPLLLLVSSQLPKLRTIRMPPLTLAP